MNDEWVILVCPVCGWGAHTPRPVERCPNDGMPVAEMLGTISNWKKRDEIVARFAAKPTDPVLTAIADGVRGVVEAAHG